MLRGPSVVLIVLRRPKGQGEAHDGELNPKRKKEQT